MMNCADYPYEIRKYFQLFKVATDVLENENLDSHDTWKQKLKVSHLYRWVILEIEKADLSPSIVLPQLELLFKSDRLFSEGEPTTKICSKCKERKSIEMFSKYKSKKIFGRSRRCKQCRGVVQSHNPDPIARFWEKVDKNGPNGCWIWTAGKSSKGYGHYRLDNKMQLSRRLSYNFSKGDIPEGLELDHLCRTPLCVNPDHLEPVTHQVNMARSGEGRRKTHCIRGHEFNEENTAYSGGDRSCKECSRLRDKQRKENRRNRNLPESLISLLNEGE